MHSRIVAWAVFVLVVPFGASAQSAFEVAVPARQYPAGGSVDITGIRSTNRPLHPSVRAETVKMSPE